MERMLQVAAAAQNRNNLYNLLKAIWSTATDVHEEMECDWGRQVCAYPNTYCIERRDFMNVRDFQSH